MKSLAKQSYDLLWVQLRDNLIDISADRHLQDMPEIDLLVAVIIQAAKDHDELYFTSRCYEEHCYLLKINPLYAILFIKKAWEFEKSGLVWHPTKATIDEEWEN